MKDGLCPDMPTLVNDWISSSRRRMMTLEEQGAYWLLLCHAWNDPDCCLPDDDIALARISELGRKWVKSGKLIRSCFQIDKNKSGFLYNAKQRSVRDEQNARIAGAREKASKAAQARWHKPSSSIAQALPEQCSRIAQASSKHMLHDASSLLSRPSALKVQSTEASPLVVAPELSHAIAAYWNTKGQLSKVQSLGPKRLKGLNARIKEEFFLRNWKAAIDLIAVSGFCTGHGPRGWRADIDWFIRPETVTRIMEGKYDDRAQQTGANTEHTNEF